MGTGGGGELYLTLQLLLVDLPSSLFLVFDVFCVFVFFFVFLCFFFFGEVLARTNAAVVGIFT